MPKYLVALAVGGLMECPEITYQDYQEIEADSEEDACKIYNEKNNCDFFYGAVIRKLNDLKSDELIKEKGELLSKVSSGDALRIYQLEKQLQVELDNSHCLEIELTKAKELLRKAFGALNDGFCHKDCKQCKWDGGKCNIECRFAWKYGDEASTLLNEEGE